MICKVDANGNKRWFLDGKLHREDSPAIETYNGTKIWYRNGELHREDGSAVEYTDGSKEWFLYGKRIICSDNEEFIKLIKMKVLW